ncbi:unnamed protein product [Candidula unifasciata]|uniref:Cilia- and flagella-associated protein 91 n=1 Tax=Candidula unifasciata TaxID=100452 RepID=A0A8S3YZM8_9EUPU|nr:unnamed protein product [Candidula unifasciata]
MATTTRTITRALSKDTRTLDCIYDENYIECSKRDYDRMSYKARAQASSFERVPVFKNMFSELQHYPCCQLKVNCPFPAHLTPVWRSGAYRNTQSWIRYQTLNSYIPPRTPIPNSTDYNKMVVHRSDAEVYNSGPSVKPSRQETLLKQSQLPHSSIEDDCPKTVETQTDYRDSEAQTDPFSPLYVVPTGDAPELISLATLSWGKGLPAGLAEVQMIGRLRGKRAWEAILRGVKNSSEMKERRRVMIMIEANEWLTREQQIERLQEARLKVTKRLLLQREEFHQKKIMKKLDKIWAVKQKEKESALKKIRREHVSEIRRILRHRAPVPRTSFKRNIAKEYADPSSQVYAPMTRLGRFMDRNSQLYVVTSKHLSTYEGLLDLEASLPDFVLKPRVTIPPPPRSMRRSRIHVRPCTSNVTFEESTEVVDINFEEEGSQSSNSYSSRPSRFSKFRLMNENLEELTSQQSKGEGSRKSTLKQLQTSFQVNQTVTQPSTPESKMFPDNDVDESQKLAVTLIQQLIRGRSVQNKMFEGKERYRDLISEVKASLLFDTATNQTVKQHKQHVTETLHEQRARNEHKESLVNDALQELESKSVGECLDFLSKELLRLEEERRIHAFAIICERQRRERELAEGRIRQQEMRRRDEEDEIFKEILKTHQCSVDGYLDQVISATLDHTADEQSKLEIQRQAETINDLAYDCEKYRDQIMSEEIAADLVHSFLIPEAKKKFIREKVRRNQRRFLIAAHEEIYLMENPFLGNDSLLAFTTLS